jgi:hypothetical protein
MPIIPITAVYCFSKALFLIHAIHVRFGQQSPLPFPIPATSRLPVSVGDVLPSLLVHLGVIDLSASPSLSHLFPDAGNAEKLTRLLEAAPPAAESSVKTKQASLEGPAVTLEQAYILRAAAVDACELIVEFAQTCPSLGHGHEWIKSITLPDLSRRLLSLARGREDYRELERFVLRNTVFF